MYNKQAMDRSDIIKKKKLLSIKETRMENKKEHTTSKKNKQKNSKTISLNLK